MAVELLAKRAAAHAAFAEQTGVVTTGQVLPLRARDAIHTSVQTAVDSGLRTRFVQGDNVDASHITIDPTTPGPRDRIFNRLKNTGRTLAATFVLGTAACSTETPPPAPTISAAPTSEIVTPAPEVVLLKADTLRFKGILEGNLNKKNDEPFWAELTKRTESSNISSTFAVEHPQDGGDIKYGYWLTARNEEAIDKADVQLLERSETRDEYFHRTILFRVNSAGEVIESNGDERNENTIPKEQLERVAEQVLGEQVDNPPTLPQKDRKGFTFFGHIRRPDGHPSVTLYLRSDGYISVTALTDPQEVKAIIGK